MGVILRTARLIFFKLLIFFLLWFVDLFHTIWHQTRKTASDMILSEGELSQEMYPRSPQRILQVANFIRTYNNHGKTPNVPLSMRAHAHTHTFTVKKGEGHSLQE